MGKPSEEQLSQLRAQADRMVELASLQLEGAELNETQRARFKELAMQCGMEYQGAQWVFEGQPGLEDAELLGQELSYYITAGRLRHDRRSGRMLVALAASMGVEL